ncbi:hypothetical protein ACSSS7_002002 [Eimeria intestinalis]
MTPSEEGGGPYGAPSNEDPARAPLKEGTSQGPTSKGGPSSGPPQMRAPNGTVSQAGFLGASRGHLTWGLKGGPHVGPL